MGMGIWGSVIDSASAGLQAIEGRNAIANAQQHLDESSDQSQQWLKDQYGKTQGYLDPYSSAGRQGLNNLMAMTTPGYQFNPSDPSVDWRMRMGQKALERGSSKSLLSGTHLKALEDYAQGLASTEYGKDWERNMNLANLGYGSATQQANYSNQFGTNYSNGILNRGNVDAAGIMARYNNWATNDSRAAGAWSGSSMFGGSKPSNVSAGSNTLYAAPQSGFQGNGNQPLGQYSNMGQQPIGGVNMANLGNATEDYNWTKENNPWSTSYNGW